MTITMHAWHYKIVFKLLIIFMYIIQWHSFADPHITLGSGIFYSLLHLHDTEIERKGKSSGTIGQTFNKWDNDLITYLVTLQSVIKIVIVFDLYWCFVFQFFENYPSGWKKLSCGTFKKTFFMAYEEVHFFSSNYFNCIFRHNFRAPLDTILEHLCTSGLNRYHVTGVGRKAWTFAQS